MKRSIVLILITVISLLTNINAALFSEDFEGDLSQWTGYDGGPYTGQIVEDPLQQGNHVVNFTALSNGGDIFSTLINVPDGVTVYLSFDYLGLEKTGSVPDDLGGFIGRSRGLPGTHEWLAATAPRYSSALQLIDDGSWHSYVLEFATGPTSYRVMVEDWIGSYGVTEDAYFDNIQVAVPEPCTMIMLGIGSLIALRRRNKR